MKRIQLPLTVIFSLIGAAIYATDLAKLVVQEVPAEGSSNLYFSAAGNLLGSCGKDIRLWNLEGKLIRRIQLVGGNSACAFSPVAEQLAVATGQNEIVILDFSGREIRRLPKQVSGIKTLAFSGDGTMLASLNGTSIFATPLEGEPAAKAMQAGHTETRVLAVSPDGRFIAAAGDNGHVSAYAVDTGLQLFRSNSAGEVRSVAFSRDGQKIITAHSGKTSTAIFFTKRIGEIRIWSLNGKELESFSTAGEAYSVAAAPDGQTIVSGSYDGILEFWSMTGKRLAQIETLTNKSESVSNAINAIALHPNTGQVALVNWNKSIMLYNAERLRLFDIRPFNFGFSGIELGAGDKSLALGPDHMLLWHQVSGAPKYVKLPWYSPGELSFASSDDGATIFVVSGSTTGDRTIAVFDGEGNFQRALSGHTANVNDVAYMSSTRTFISAGQDGKLGFWSADGVLKKMVAEPGAVLYHVAVDSGRKTVIAVTHQGKIHAYNSDGAPLWSGNTGVNYPGEIAIAPDGQIVVPGFGKGVQLWSPDGQLQQNLRGHGANELSAAFSKNGKFLATGDMNGNIVIWNRAGKVLHNLNGHTTYVKNLRFSSDSRYLISASWDSVVVFWDTKTFDEAARMVLDRNGDFALAVNDGRFDSSGNASEKMHWVTGDVVVPLSEFSQKFYTPGLLGELLGAKAAPIKPEISVAKRLIGRVFQIKANGDVVIFTKVSGSPKNGKKLKILNGANYVDATINNTLHTNVTARAKGTVAVGNPVFE